MSATAFPLHGAPLDGPDAPPAPAAREDGAAPPAEAPSGRRRDKDAPARRAARATSRGGALQALAALLWLPQAAAIAFAISDIAGGRAMDHALPAAAAVLGLGLIRAGLEAWGARLVFRAARDQLTRLRAEVARALAGRSPLDAARPAAGLAASAMAEQAEAVVPYLTRFVPARQRLSIVPLAILAVVAPLSWVAALVLLIAAPLIPLFMALVGWRAKAASEAQMVELGSMNAFLLDRLRGLATIRALDAVDLTARRLRENVESLRRRTMAVLRIAFLSSAVLELFSALGVAMVAVYVGFHLLGHLGFGAWGGRLSLGEGLFILLLAPAFFEPLRDFSSAWHDRAAGEAAFDVLAALSRQGTPLPGAHDQAAPAAGPTPDVRIAGLAFRHAGASAGAPVLDGFCLHVAAGERVAVVGPSGVGKSTLIALIAGLVPANGGEITIGGVPLAAGTAAALRARMAYLGQAPHIFAGTLPGNIALGRPGIGAGEVAEAARLAAFAEVMAAHGGDGGSIGEAGMGLSGGEARRLALARAAADPAAGLILADEPTAHLDADTAAQVTEGLLALARGRTLIVATHDPALAARMDRVVRLGPEPEDAP